MLRWYKKQGVTIRAALLGGIFTILAAALGSIFELFKPNPPIVINFPATLTSSTMPMQTANTPTPTFGITSSTQSPETLLFEDLDTDASEWGVFVESATQDSTRWVKNNVASPSIDGRALECWPILSDIAYTNIQCYRRLPLSYDVKAVVLNLSFWFFPSITCNDQVNPSLVQALEFSINIFRQSARYEFAMQWDNVGDDAPRWRYWANNEWTVVNPPINQCLQGEQWHTFTLQGRIQEGVLYYKSFAIDDQEYSLGLSFVPVSSNEPDLLAIGVQVDGNKVKRPYEFVIDKVSLAITP